MRRRLRQRDDTAWAALSSAMGIEPERHPLDGWTRFLDHVVALDWRRHLGLLDRARLSALEVEALVVLAQEQQRQETVRRE